MQSTLGMSRLQALSSKAGYSAGARTAQISLGYHHLRSALIYSLLIREFLIFLNTPLKNMNTRPPRTMGSRPQTITAPATASSDSAAVLKPLPPVEANVPSFLASPNTQTSIALADIVGPAPSFWDGSIQMPHGLQHSLVPYEQAQSILAQVHETSIHTLSPMQIASLAAEPEIALHQSLGAFLDRVDKSDSPQIFRLVSELNTAVKAENLEDLADKILSGKPALMERLIGMVSRKKLVAAQSAAFENLQLLVSGKSRTLSAVIDKMQAQINIEKAKAMDEAQALERIKENYRLQFGQFVLATVFLNTLLSKGRHELAMVQQAIANGSYSGQMTLEEAQDKVQALESRALAVENVMTKLPAEQLVVRQVQTAIIQTVQEVTTTAASRFASIKMTLLTLHSAMGAQNLQRTAQQGADLDANLSQVRTRLVASVVATAANAPGDNRLAQAQQIKEITQGVRELVAIAEKARSDNKRKFDEARLLLSQARDELTSLGAVIRPDKPMSQLT